MRGMIKGLTIAALVLCIVGAVSAFINGNILAGIWAITAGIWCGNSLNLQSQLED